VLSALRGCAGERAFHFLFNALHCAGAHADLSRGGVDALPGAQLSLNTFFDGWAGSKPARADAAFMRVFTQPI
jgi:hypothetical protein